MVVITLDLFAFSCRTQVLASSVWALGLSLREPTPLAVRRRFCQPRAPLCSSSFQVVDKHSGFPSTVTGVLFNYHLGTALCPSSSATPQGLGQWLGSQANWTLGKKLQQRPKAYWATGAETARRSQHSLDPIQTLHLVLIQDTHGQTRASAVGEHW